MATNSASQSGLIVNLFINSSPASMSASANNNKSSKSPEEDNAREAALDIGAAAALINLSRDGTKLPKFTIAEAANILRVFGREPEANPTLDRAAALVNSSYAEKLIEWAAEFGYKLPGETEQPTENPKARKATRKRKSNELDDEIHGDAQNAQNANAQTAKAGPSPTTRRKRKSQDAELDSIEADTTVAATPKEAPAVKRLKTKVSPPEVAQPRQNSGFVHVNQPRRSLRSSSRIPKPSLRAREASEAFSTSTVKPDYDEEAEEVTSEAEPELASDTEDEDEEDSPASDTTTSSTPAPGNNNGPAPRKRRAGLTRNRVIIAYRGHIEMFGMAVQNVMKRHLDTKHEHQIPDYSPPYSFPAEEYKIADLLFAKDVKDGRVKNSGMIKERAREKYANIKKRCLFGAALLYELNCHVEEAKSRGENPFPDMPPTPTTEAAAAARLAQAQANATASTAAVVHAGPTNSTTTSTTPEASNNPRTARHTTRSRSTTATPAPPTAAQPATPAAAPAATAPIHSPAVRRSILALYDINATRLQPSSGIDVTIVRPLFRAFRPVDDPTFIKPESRGKSPAFERLVAGLLADKGWFPAMVGKSTSDQQNGKKPKDVLVNREWYEALGDKEERRWWLRKVLDEKNALEMRAVSPEEKKRMIREMEEAKRREREGVAAEEEAEEEAEEATRGAGAGVTAGGRARKRNARARGKGKAKAKEEEDVKEEEAATAAEE